MRLVGTGVLYVPPLGSARYRQRGGVFMRRLMLLVVSVLMVVTMAVSPAFAHDRDGDGWDEDFGFWILVPVFIDFDFDGIDDNFDCDFVWCDGDSDEGDWNGHHDFGFDNCELEWSDVFEEWEIEC
jgi:hypothetical protein